MAVMTLAGLAAQSAVAASPVNDGSGTPDAKKSAAPEIADAQATPAQTVHNFNIPAGTLAEALTALEKETGISVSLASEKIGGLQSPGVTGVLTEREALTHLLENTGVSARFEDEGRVVLSVAGDSSSVTVTAQGPSSPKYTAPLVDLPQTITVVSAETMQNTASTTLMEALRTVPGITFGAGEGGNPLGDRPFIRGLDSQASTYIDGMRDIAAQSREVFDVESIEVQEGPGGAYGGRGTGGGSINMNSKLARHSNFVAGSFMPGTSNYKRATVDANTELNHLVAGRLTGMWHDADVAGRDAVHNSRWGAAPSLAIGLGGPTRAFLDYYHLITNDLPDSGTPYNNPSKIPTNDPGPQILQPGDGEPLTLPHRSLFWGLSDRDQDRDTAKIATGRVEHDLWNARSLLRNTFRYERTEQNYLWTLPDDSQGNLYYGLLFRRINSRVSAVFTDDNQTDLSGQFQTSKVKHSYATGAEFSKERGNNDQYTNNSTSFSGATETCPQGAGAPSGYNCTLLFSPDYHDPWKATGTLTLNHNPTHSTAVTQSVYGFDTIQFNQHFQSTVGGRYDHFNSTFRTAITAGVSTPYSVTNNIGTYLASLIYKPDHASSIYGTVSTAAIPTGDALAQGVDTSALNSQINADLQPETIREEEIGAKRELSGGRTLARIDFYREDIKNVRITQADGTVAAAGNDRTLGAEAGISGQLTNKWQFTGGYTYIDAILLDAGGTGTANGQALPNTAKHAVAITSSYKLTHRLNAGGGIYGMTRVWGSQVNNKWVPGYVREDLFGNYEFNEHWNLQANVLNLSDRLYYQQAYATHYAIEAPGRSAVFGLNVRF
ncbi:TonB-dependent siderophore receptor [Acidipila sp. EB88]|nr:TonB-dependent siderophore receptor [Acidipila sp. EB88]